jgi:solute carrier family 13 (sodium-dependent dicarboxylate transporter), member 2/3/5
MSRASSPAGPPLRRAGLWAGPLLAALLLALPVPDGLGPEGWRMAAVAALMAVWWITEAVPIPATALLPIALLPALDVMPVERAAAPFANPIIFLFLGGFLLAAGIEASGLHRRLALRIIRLVGTAPARIVAGFMAATALLSMGVSNTATVVMLLPLATSVVDLNGGETGPDPAFGAALMLGLAYAANLGGIGTLIGTPPNALLAGYLAETFGVELGFGAWMLVGLPLVLVAVPVTWLLLTRVLYPVSRAPVAATAAVLSAELRALGPMRRSEALAGIVTGAAAAAWVFRPALEGALPGLSDAGIAIGAALLMFMLPGDRSGRLLDWDRARKLPWGALVLFGGGLSLAAGIQGTGLADWLGSRLHGLAALPAVASVLLVTALIVFLTEFTSNTATAAAFLPVAAALAAGIGVNPMLLLVPTAVAASCAFMMPIATPPNAIVYGSGHVTQRQMMRAGVWLNLIMIGVITAVALTLVPRVLPAP